MSEPEKTPGQIDYENFCNYEWKWYHRMRDSWETLPPSAKGEWEAAAVMYQLPKEEG